MKQNVFYIKLRDQRGDYFEHIISIPEGVNLTELEFGVMDYTQAMVRQSIVREPLGHAEECNGVREHSDRETGELTCACGSIIGHE